MYLPGSVDSTTGESPALGSAAVALSLAVLLAGRAAFHLLSGPLPDEAYYWLWGQHPALSYYDHPPLQAWLQAASTALFGNTLFGLRAPALLTTGWIVVLLAWWARRAQGFGVPASLPHMAAVFFASPLVFVYTTIVFNDHLMVALVCTAAAAFTVALGDAGRHGRINAAALYTAGLATGFAALAKYNAALFGFGAAAAILFVPRFRPILRSPHLYASAVLAVICIAPVLAWNWQNEAASFQYNFADRLAPHPQARVVENIATFVALSILALSPPLTIALGRFLADRRPAAWSAGWRPLAISTFTVSTLVCIALTPFTAVLFYWNIVAYLAFLPYAALYMGRHLTAAHLGVGMLVAVLYPINYAVLPLSALFGPADSESAMTYGWHEVAGRVEEERRARGAEFLLASDYRIGAILAFHTGDTRVEVISARRSQFDLWFDEAVREGQDALILTDDWHPLAQIHQERFGSIETVAELPVIRFGRTLKTYTLYLGRDYIAR